MEEMKKKGKKEGIKEQLDKTEKSIRKGGQQKSNMQLGE